MIPVGRGNCGAWRGRGRGPETRRERQRAADEGEVYEKAPAADSFHHGRPIPPDTAV